VKLRNLTGRPVIVSLHDELASGPLLSILRRAGLSHEELLDLLA